VKCPQIIIICMLHSAVCDSSIGRYPYIITNLSQHEVDTVNYNIHFNNMKSLYLFAC